MGAIEISFKVLDCIRQAFDYKMVGLERIKILSILVTEYF
jgi:hypothetical protein